MDLKFKLAWLLGLSSIATGYGSTPVQLFTDYNYRVASATSNNAYPSKVVSREFAKPEPKDTVFGLQFGSSISENNYRKNSDKFLRFNQKLDYKNKCENYALSTNGINDYLSSINSAFVSDCTNNREFESNTFRADFFFRK